MKDRRNLIRGLAVGSVWATPVVSSVVLPVHAEATNAPVVNLSGTGEYQNIVNFDQQTTEGQWVFREPEFSTKFVDTVISPSHAVEPGPLFNWSASCKLDGSAESRFQVRVLREVLLDNFVTTGKPKGFMLDSLIAPAIAEELTCIMAIVWEGELELTNEGVSGWSSVEDSWGESEIVDECGSPGFRDLTISLKEFNSNTNPTAGKVVVTAGPTASDTEITLDLSEMLLAADCQGQDCATD